MTPTLIAAGLHSALTFLNSNFSLQYSNVMKQFRNVDSNGKSFAQKRETSIFGVF
jgi:hypothetical protein